MKRIIDSIDQIRIENFIQYLIFLNWHKVCDIPNYGYQYASKDEKFSAIILSDKTLKDYNEVLLQSLKTVSEYTNTSIESLLLNILYPAYDKIKWRIPSLTNNIPFLVLPELLKSIKESFTVAINDLNFPSLYHENLKKKEANKLFNDMQFGQTEIGSYIINVLSPLDAYQWNMYGIDKIPLSRQVNEKVLKSIHSISTDVDLGNKSKIEEAIEQNKYSVNFLESIIDIQEKSKENSIDIIADWCANLPPSQGTPSIATIKRNQIDTIGQIVEKYTNKITNVKTETFVGKISTIESEPEIDNRKYIRIKMVTIGDNQKAVNVFSNLDYDENFNLVQDAFSKGLNVIIKGKYDENSKKKEIKDASLQILE